jgi:hypothetical protein
MHLDTAAVHQSDILGTRESDSFLLGGAVRIGALGRLRWRRR